MSIIIPAYDEETAMERVVDSLHEVMETSGLAYEIIVVDDGSTHQTAAVAETRDVHLLRHPDNRGYGAALKTGLRHAGHDLIAITDTDGAYPTDHLPEPTRLDVSAGYVVVVGARAGAQVHMPVARRPAKWVLGQLANCLARATIPGLNSGPRVFRREVAEEFRRYLPSGFSFTTTPNSALFTSGQSVRYVPISYSRRMGRSKISPIKDTPHVIGLIIRTAMYFAPLRVLLPISGALLLVALLVLVGSALFTPRIMDVTIIVISMTTLQIAVVALVADLIEKRHWPLAGRFGQPPACIPPQWPTGGITKPQSGPVSSTYAHPHQSAIYQATG